MDPDFSGSDPDFWPIRIQKKKTDSDPGKKTGSETLTPRCVSICCICSVIVSTESDSVMCYQSGVAEKFFFVK